MTKEGKLIAEKERLRLMYEKQNEISGTGFPVFGIDEAGRGPLCGPVVAACCLLDPGEEILYLNDSKKIPEKKREQIFEEITEKCIVNGIGTVSPERIDQINILNATYEAMSDAFDDCIRKLSQNGTAVDEVLRSCTVLIDGNRAVPQISAKQITVVGGDALCPSISAASILAKVTRDRMMYRYDELYPEYGFGKHKGYGTREHIEALKKFGPTDIHRRSFIRKFVYGAEQ